LRARSFAFAIALALPGAALALGEGEGPGRAQFVHAARLSGLFRLDGVLDEEAWQAAEPFDRFVQIFPAEGAAPSERTVVRVLYDDGNLYVGVLCEDRHPADIVRPLGRRDSPPSSDNVQILIDADHDHRTAVAFALTAAGVQSDGLFYDDDRYTGDWDAVWDGRVAATATGWSAEFVIPLSVFRFSDAPVQTWGFGVRRELGRSHEVDTSVLIPRNARGVVSRLGHVTGIADVKPRRDVEVAPYLATRLSLRPQYSYEDGPFPRLADPTADLGLDVRARLGHALTLNAAVNPDFGQVEADQIILNLTTFETFRPEKRPFFTQGLDLFQPVGTGNENVPQQLFYSRRVGLDTPILGAAKVTGKASDSVQVGVLDAFVTGSGLPVGVTEALPDRRMGLHLAQPFHVGPRDAAPLATPLTQNFFAGVARWRAADGVTLGATVTSAVPVGPRCTAREYDLDDVPSAAQLDEARPRRCTVRSGNAAALDWSLRTRDSEWGAYGQVAGSQVLGGPPVRTLADGTELRAGEMGYGAYLTAGRLGGEPFRFELHYEYESPRLDLNASGFQRTQNEQVGQVTLRWVRPSGSGPLHDYNVFLRGRTQWTTDGRRLNRGNAVGGGAGGLLKKPYLGFGCEGGVEDPRLDVRELGTGVPLVRSPWWIVGCGLETDPARLVSGSLNAAVGRNFAWAPLAPVWFAGAEANLTLRPHARLETRLGVVHEQNAFAVKYMDDDGAGRYLLAQLHGPTLSVTLRQLLVLTPRLTLQAYAQLFSAFEHDGPYWTATSQGATITPRSLVPVSPADAGWRASYDTHQTALNLNVVLRWEYRLGSLLYLVYSRAQHEAQPDGFVGPSTLTPRALGLGPTIDTLLVKWSYWWNP